MLVDYSVVTPKNPDGSCSILAVVSTREFITSYISLFKEAKIELEVIDLVQNCLIKMMKRLKSLQGKKRQSYYQIFRHRTHQKPIHLILL